MGLTVLPEVGAGELLGPVKQDTPLDYPDAIRDILSAEHNAAMAALEGVCAEVGLHDGSTPGSLVERVTALEGGGGGTGDVVGPASAVNNNLVAFDTTTGKLVKDSGIAASAITSAASAASSAQTTANGAIQGPGSSTDSNIVAFSGTTGKAAGDSGVPVSLVLVGARGAGVNTVSATPATAVDGGNRFHSIIDTTAVGGDVTINIPHTLTAQVSFDFRIKGAFGLILNPTGGIALTYHGAAAGTITGDGVVARVVVESATVGHVYVFPVGVTVEALDALYPLVQTAHTASTKTLAAGDAGDIIPLNGASNAIAVTIPHTLFAAGGTGRAWSCGFYVTSVAGGAITFAGSGGIVIKYFGKKPSATAIVAGDTIFVTVVSATLAHVWISAEIP